MLAVLAGCEYPRDADGTLERVRGGELRVGVAPRPPWMEGRGGIEARLVDAFAEQLGAKLRWVEGAEADLVKALEKRHVDLVVGGLTRDSPWKKKAAPSRPFLQTEIVIAAPPGMAPPARKEHLEGRAVAYRAHRPDIAARLAEAGAKPVPEERLGGRLAAVYAFETGRLGLTPTKIVLAKEEHIMLAPPGESRFLLELDRFLTGPGRRLALAAP